MPACMHFSELALKKDKQNFLFLLSQRPFILSSTRLTGFLKTTLTGTLEDSYAELGGRVQNFKAVC